MTTQIVGREADTSQVQRLASWEKHTIYKLDNRRVTTNIISVNFAYNRFHYILEVYFERKRYHHVNVEKRYVYLFNKCCTKFV